MISSFTGEFRWLSNFWPCHIEMDGEIYDSVEHAFQASKTLNEEQRWIIRMAGKPGLAKKLGNQVTLRQDWEDIKLSIMGELVMQKFSKDPELKAKLLDTGDEQIVEGNHWGDCFWGVCGGVGKNHLGKILMQVRERLRSSQPWWVRSNATPLGPP